MTDETQHLARALIAAHGTGALAVAEQALANVRTLNMRDKIAEWEKVIAAIKEMQAAKR
jgi:hypothetical protein